jgi:putative ABC transport system permease protein
MKKKDWANFYIALDAVLANKLRSILTGLGIIFGVSAVIAMLAVGNGAQQEILEQIKLVGVNNIVVTPVYEQSEEEVEEKAASSGKKHFSPGLTMLDVESLQKIIPSIQRLSPEVLLETYIIKNGIRRSAKLVGVENDYFGLANFDLASGRFFNEHQLEKGEPVCIIGKGLQSRFFSQEDPIGKMIKVGPHWLKVVGVLEPRVISKKSIENLGIRDYNMDVYTPLKTVLIRYKNRALVTDAMLQQGKGDAGGGMIIISSGGNEEEESTKGVNYHQLDRVVVQVAETRQLNATADVIARLLERRHYGMVDFEITIPELLLKQQQRTKKIFNIVLGAIAGISLLVGGIGIMNIMLASVLERIKEIGLRLSIGAKKKDIVLQFLFEAVMISVTGGIIGVVLGISMAMIISSIAEIPTIISISSVLISFGVAAAVGLIFGIAPARKAASQNPITSLRYE